MMYSDKYKYVYISPSKTGSSSIQYFLKNYYDGHLYGSIHGNEIPNKFKDYFIFVSMRNIYERAISLWVDFGKLNLSFKEFMIDLIFKNQFSIPPNLEELRSLNSYFQNLNRQGRKYVTVRLESIKHDMEYLPFVDRKFEIHLGRTKNRLDCICAKDERKLVVEYEGGLECQLM